MNSLKQLISIRRVMKKLSQGKKDRKKYTKQYSRNSSAFIR